MWPDRRLCDLFDIEIPIIQAPMLGTCTPALASAVANAGALGSLACATKSPESAREEVGDIRALTNRSFNLNFFVNPAPQTDPEVLKRTRERLRTWYDRLGLGEPPTSLPVLPPGFEDKQLDLLLELRPKVVSFHFGSPDVRAIEALRDAGVVMISSATSVAEARALEDAGMDAIIAQGWEAGGHRGSHVPREPLDGVGTMALVPQVVDAVSVPVIAAGGIADGRGIAAALALGASGVQMGTAFLRCPEAATDPARRKRLEAATDSDTLVTDAVSGRSARAVRSRFAKEMGQNRETLPAFGQMYALSRPIVEAAEDDDASFLLYGQAAPLARDMKAGDLVHRLAEDTLARCAALSSH